MRRFIQLSTACLAVGALSACNDLTQSVETENIPTAGVRFINAVPDTAGSGGIDLRWVDIVENNAQYAIPFRNNIVTTSGVPASTLVEYKATRAGSRHFKIFLNDTLPAVASNTLKDSTVNIEAGHRYTYLLWGNARGGANPMKLTIIDETHDPGTQVGLRVINTSGTAVDVRQYLATGTAPATATWSNVAPYSISSYVTVAPQQVKFNVQPAGGGTALFTDPTALIGVPQGTVSGGCTAGVDCDLQPGTTVAGSDVTAIIFPRSTVGSKVSQAAAFQVPAISFIWDKRPPRPAGS
jgi:hypothetical protein